MTKAEIAVRLVKAEIPPWVIHAIMAACEPRDPEED